MLKTFIERPVLSTVISIIIVVLGIIGLTTLPVEQYPDIAPPTVQVQTFYSGANADVIMKSVIIPLEEQINGVEGMTYMTSTASNSGMANITVFFKPGIDPDIAAVNVQNLVARATSQLPAEVNLSGVSVRKQQSSNIMMISISSDNEEEYDAKFLQNFANINLLPQLKRIQGVGDASVFGAKDYSMRIWFKPDVLASYGMSVQEAVAAIQDQNIEAAPGSLGQNSDQSFQYTMKYTGRLKSVEEFSNIIIRSQNGMNVYLKDVADVELGSLDYSILSSLDGKVSLGIGISQTAGSNASEVIENVKIELENAAKSFPPGVKYVLVSDASEFLDASIEKVIHTLIEAFILVFIVVFVFLQDFRSTLIPAIAVPVAIVGTFFFLKMFGFSINLLTLFALVLAIGIVVDDAIVVVEAVHAQLDAGEKDAKKATMQAMKEIAPAIVSITLVMSAVFVPVSFIEGTSGVFYKQFGLTLAISIIISAVNALTLSPALCAVFLKPHKEGEEHHKKGFMNRFFYNFNLMFNAATQKYKSSLHFLGRKNNRWITVAIILVSTLLFFGLQAKIPKDFVPNEDGGGAIGMITLPPGASLERTDEITSQVVDITRAIPGVKNVLKMSGLNLMNGGLSSSGGVIFIKMDPWSERDISVNELTAILKEKTDTIKDATFFFTGTPTLQGFGISSGVAIQMQDKTGGDINYFADVVNDFMRKVDARPEVLMSMNPFNPNYPQKQIIADLPKIKEAGITLSQVMSTLQMYVGSMYVSNFNLYGKQFRVMVQAAPEYRSKLEDLSSIYVQTANGTMAPITTFVSIEPTTGPETLTRFNLFQSMSLTFIPNFAEGYGTGDVIKAVQEEAASLPEGFTFDYSGITREEVGSGSQTFLIFALCLIFVYLLLAALYESYILPLAVILSLPVGLAGVYIFIMGAVVAGTGIFNNIYVQISLIMLIGLLAKNAILIVEYAIQRRQQGMSIVDAAINGAVARLRPILMTSFAFIFGLMPLALSSGAGAVGNKSIGISAVGGMLIGTMIGVLVIPSLYIIFQTIQDKFSKSGMVNSNDEFINQQK